MATEVRPEDNSLSGTLSELVGDWFDRGGRAVGIRVVTVGEVKQAAAARYPTAREMFLRTAVSEGTTILDVAA